MKALYPGSFDPFTIGHLSIVEDALEIFDEIIIGVGCNEEKRSEWSVETRVSAISSHFDGNPRIKVVAYSGLTAEFAKKNGISVLVRGVRNSLDFEKEKELADINKEVLRIPTVLLPARPSQSYISSSMVRELIHNGYNAKEFIVGDFPEISKRK